MVLKQDLLLNWKKVHKIRAGVCLKKLIGQNMRVKIMWKITLSSLGTLFWHGEWKYCLLKTIVQVISKIGIFK